MRILNEQDILQAVSLDDVLDGIEKALAIYENNDFFMPHRVHIDHGTKTLLYMPCIADGALGTKYLTLFPDNIPKGIPTLYGLMILNDYATGKPLCILDGKTLTALRTGAVGGTGIKYTTPEQVSRVGVIGAGVQGWYQLRYAAHVRKLSTVYLYDNNMEKLPDFAHLITTELGSDITVEICPTTADLLDKSEVIITTTTATSPVLPNDPDALRGKHYIGIGSYKPTMREFPDALYQVVDNLFIDTEIAKEETGDLSQPLANGLLQESQIRSLGNYIFHGTDHEVVKNSTTLVKSVGMAIFDVVVGQLIYQMAEQKNIGTTVNM